MGLGGLEDILRRRIPREIEAERLLALSARESRWRRVWIVLYSAGICFLVGVMVWWAGQ